jgi:hypothetical protein
MTKEQACKIIVDAVSSVGGCKLTELILHEKIREITREVGQLADMVEELVERGELVEVEYIRPDADYRVKSFLLPKGSVFSSGGTLGRTTRT